MAVSGGALRLLIPAEAAGRIIGRRGVRIQEVQKQSGARIQISDSGEGEKLVEVAGSCESVGEAVERVLEDLVPRPPKGRSRGEPENEGVKEDTTVGVLVPERLVDWAIGQESGASPLATDGVGVSLSGTYDGDADRRIVLCGQTAPVGHALRVLGLRLRRHARWLAAGAAELPWRLCDTHEEGDPKEDFISAVNFRLLIPDTVLASLTGAGSRFRLIAQVQEDTGATIRVQAGSLLPKAGSSSAIEIAGVYGAKLKALLEVASLLMHLVQEATTAEVALDPKTTGAPAPTTEITAPAASDAAASLSTEPAELRVCLELLLPLTGPASIAVPEARKLAEVVSDGVEVSGGERKEGLVVRLRGSRSACAAGAVAVCRASERQADAHEREHGPPPLLIDYLTRWFGRDGKRWPHGAISGGTRRRGTLPVNQIAHRKGYIAPDLLAPPSPLEEDVAEGPVEGPDNKPEAKAGLKKAKPQQASGPKRRRRNLSNPFMGADGAAEALGPEDEPESGVAAGAVPLPIAVAKTATEAQDAAMLVAGYDDDDIEAGLAGGADSELDMDVEGEEVQVLEELVEMVGKSVVKEHLEDLGQLPWMGTEEAPEDLPIAPAPLELQPLPTVKPLAPLGDPLWERRQAILRKLEQKC